MQRAASFLPTAFSNFLPKTGKRVLLVGGGSAGVFVAEKLRHLFDITVVDPKSYFEFSPSMCRALLQPHSTMNRITFTYKDVLEEKLGVNFIQGRVIDLKPDCDGVSTSSVSSPSSTKKDCSVDSGSSRSSSDDVDRSSERSSSSTTTATIVSSKTQKNSGGTAVIGNFDGKQKIDDVRWDYCVICSGVGNGIWKQQFESLDERKDQIRQLYSQLREQERIHVVGAGIVGVEVAAEIAWYLRKKVEIYDGNPRLLFQLPPEAHEYAREWLESRGCNLHLSQGFDFENYGKDPNVLTCVGVKSNITSHPIGSYYGSISSSDSSESSKQQRKRGFLSAKYLDHNDFVKVNRELQVLGAKGTDGKITEHEVLGNVFACGDCVTLEGAPKTLYVAEEMASIVVSNIEKAEGFDSDMITNLTTQSSGGMEKNLLGKKIEKTGDHINNADAGVLMTLRAMSEDLILPFCVSLGPADGIFAQNSGLSGGSIVAEGKTAALQKQLIETTKMTAMQEKGTLEKLAWSMVH